MRLGTAALIATLLVPAGAQAARRGFSSDGNILLGGGIAYSSSNADGSNVDVSELQVGPSIGWFATDGLALRFNPWLRHTGTDGDGLETDDTWWGFSFAPGYYVPLGDTLALTFGVEMGLFTGTRETFAESGGPMLGGYDASGYLLGGEAGLAIPVGTGGLIELLGSVKRYDYSERNVFGSDWAETVIGLGTRLSLVL